MALVSLTKYPSSPINTQHKFSPLVVKKRDHTQRMALNSPLHAACPMVLGHFAEVNTPQDESIRTCLTGKSTRENIPKSSESAEWMASQMESCREERSVEFQMPLHYPRFAREDYEKMEEWRVDMLLREYGISFSGTLEEKRQFAKGIFLWPEA